MKKIIKVIVNDKPYVVELNDLKTSPAEVIVNGQVYRVVLEEPAVNNPCPPVEVQPTPSTTASRPAVRVSADANRYTAPMPGVILDIAVKAGDTVSYGQQLCALEAMKMKNAIRAPRELVIASVEVSEGQKVQYGEVLFKFA
jgi:glutaconyl-CoA/methylmalonyl-CoA decarboxylase subunit gamma